MWILGEYATNPSDITAVLKQIHQTLGDGPLLDTEQKLLAGESTDETSQPAQQTTTLVTSDGTYATQSAFNAAPSVIYTIY